MAFCSYNLSSILNGLIYYDQFERLTSKQLGLVIAGIIILLIGVAAVSMQDDTEEGEPAGGVTDGDWTVAEAVASSPPVTPGFSRRSFPNITSPRRAATEFDTHHGEDGDILLSPGRRDSRRTISSPSAFSTEQGRKGLDLVLEESALGEGSRPVQSDSSISHSQTQDGTLLMSPEGRTRTLSESSPPPLRSPPRRRGRRGTFLSPSLSVSGDIQSGLGDGGADNAAAVPQPAFPGFSIGLSPLSPGFSLIPRHRDSIISLENGPVEPSTSEITPGREGRPRGRGWSAMKNVVKSLAGRRGS